MIALNELPSFLDSRSGKHLSYLLISLLTLAIALNFIQFKQIFKNSKTEIDNSYSNPSLQIKPLPDLGSLHLFGIAKIVTTELPEASLEYMLTGIFLTTPAKNSQAAITDISGQQRLYGVGATLGSNSTIYKILSSKVILEHNGRFEVLSLPKTELKLGERPKGLNALGSQ